MGTIQRIGVLGVAFVLASCGEIASSQLNNTQISTAYSVSYDDFTEQLEFEATFTVGGSPETYVALSGPSSITLDGVPLTEETDIFNQVTYTYSYTADPAEVAATHVFVYTDNDGQVFTNTVTLPLDVAINVAPAASISISHNFTLGWVSSDPLQETDAVVATISAGNETNEATESDDGTGSESGSVLFTPQQLEPLGSGSFRLVACRNQNLPVQEAPEVGGSITTSRCLPEVPVQLVP
jgi:hypothetical protein